MFSQKTTCRKNIPYFRTLNAEKLAFQLTNDLQNDSLKVIAIHCWITHHIKYDVKKSESFDFKRIPVKKILRKRKAICTGYSDLFNELCKYSNITSIEVPGYVKNKNLDLNDKFYYEEHVWNAVYVNHDWKLVDACWDAGYIKYNKRTFLGNIVFLLSFGRNEIIKIKPNFKPYPTNRYCLKKGNEFIFDHIPADPIWQLIDSIVTIENYEKDSSFYFSKMNALRNSESGTKYNDERFLFYRMSEREKIIHFGPISNTYNFKNHYPIALSQLISAMDVYEKIDTKSEDTIEVLKQCDDVLAKLLASKVQFDSTLFCYKKLKSELMINNKKKHDTLKTQTRKLLSSTIKVEKNIKAVKKMSVHAKKTINKIEKSSKKRLKKLENSEKFEKAKPLTFYNSVDSVNSVNRIKIISDSLRTLNARITSSFLHLDSLYDLNVKKIEQYAGGSAISASAMGAVNQYRLDYYDDLDFEIRSIKDSILKYKFGIDSLLFESDDVFIIKSHYKELKKIKEDFKSLNNYHKLFANECVNLKKFHVVGSELTNLYENNVSSYANELEKYGVAFNNNRSYFIEYKRVFKIKIRNCLFEKQLYSDEIEIEKKMYSLRTNRIKRKYIILFRIYRKTRLGSLRN